MLYDRKVVALSPVAIELSAFVLFAGLHGQFGQLIGRCPRHAAGAKASPLGNGDKALGLQVLKAARCRIDAYTYAFRRLPDAQADFAVVVITRRAL